MSVTTQIRAAVAASIQGATLFGIDQKKPKRKRLTLSEWQRARRMQG